MTNTTTKTAATLNTGDVCVTPNGERLTVRSVDACAAFTIVDFTDGTATRPIPGDTPIPVLRKGA